MTVREMLALHPPSVVAREDIKQGEALCVAASVAQRAQAEKMGEG